jgi:hypothetical protein
LSESIHSDTLLHALLEKGVTEKRAAEQLALLKRGTKTILLAESASIGDGIHLLESSEVNRLASLYDQRKELKVMKFVPASGAATRMFSELLKDWKEEVSSDTTRRFKERYPSLALFQELPLPQSDEALFSLLFEELKLQHAPKGTIPFHRYTEGSRAAFEEHLVEGTAYAISDGKVHLHFTIAPMHMDAVKKKMQKWTETYGERYGVTFDVEYSVQDPATDTFALEIDGSLVKHIDGSLLLRPGGHGSLIHNLNDIDADILFIKNVDNVAPDRFKADTLLYKKALAGLLIQVREEARAVLKDLEIDATELALSKARRLLSELGLDIDENKDVSLQSLKNLLDRPFRVCGMVRNQGEPGGGPFWVQRSGYRTLQIVESAQVNHDDPDQWRKMKEGTHFNPVDLVCCTKDLAGNQRSILPFRDQEAAFVTTKNFEGRDIAVLEWPGLWNGAMADWNTLFVEVPISTFTPVKTINDLFRMSHSSES